MLEGSSYLAGPSHRHPSARYHEIGRAVATIMSDEVFHEVAYKVWPVYDIRTVGNRCEVAI